MLNLWDNLNGKKTLIGTALATAVLLINTVCQIFGVDWQVPTEVNSLVLAWFGVGVTHKGVKKVRSNT